MRHATHRSERTPVFEQVFTSERETFLWRCDDYPWERNVWNVHPEYEIHLVRYTAGVALVGDHISPFEPGHLTIVGSGLPHDWVTTLAPGEVIKGRDIVVQFHPDRLRRAAAILPELASLERLLGRAMRGLAFHGQTRREGAATLVAMGCCDGVERLSLFLQLLQRLAADDDAQVLSSADFVPATDSGTMDAVGAALAFIVENFRSDLRLADLAALLGQSEWACSRFFKKNSGNTFSDYLTTLRIGAACKLLADSETPVTDICFDVGYSNVSNFNRVFRAQRGMTPSMYRRLARQRQHTSPLRTADAILRR